MNYLEFEFYTGENGISDQLIALLSELGFEGFLEEADYLKAYIKEENFDQSLLMDVLEHFHAVNFTQTTIEQINWNKQWEESFEPVIVDQFVGIRAGFHAPLLDTVIHEIIITPKMSFGTGHHNTTYLMIKAMENIDFKQKQVLDFGTGTGILAILAEKMGAKYILAIDYDPWSINNTIENIQLNHCAHIKTLQSDSIPQGETYDIILANINLNVIMEHLDALGSIAKRGTKILFSGFLRENEPVFSQAILSKNWSIEAIEQMGEWICVVANKG